MDRSLLLDGPMGTEIDRRGGDTSIPLWSARALIQMPDLVSAIHKDYILSGADIITTNTFRTQGYTIKKAGVKKHKAKDLTELAVKIAQKATDESGSNTLVAGSIAPVEDCYSPHLVPDNTVLTKEHANTAKWLIDAGVDLILIETMNTLREARIAVDAAKEYDFPVYLSLTANDNGVILDGTPWEVIIREFKDQVDLIAVNCTSLEGTGKVISQFENYRLKNWGFYPNFGMIDPKNGWSSSPIPEEYIKQISTWITKQPSLVGTCCGATPAETKSLRDILDDLK